jgi:hypothetical protein
MGDETQRVREPIHGLIVFDREKPVDMLAWKLIRTPEFQRLRRIKQLGLSDFVFPGATHSRFIHSVGVYHNARRLVGIVRRERGENEPREKVVLIAALLHDIGHGPFSHAFEAARAAMSGTRPIEKHEKFSAKLILDPSGSLFPILGEKLANEVAQLVAAEDPVDIWHAVVSSSFDADRLDYLIRDRYMTGAKTGSIDVEWLIDNLQTYDVEMNQDDDTPITFPTFVFKYKGRLAAEDFLLARYRLYSQIYFHKTTRGFEKLISAFFQHLGAADVPLESLGLDASDPLSRFLRDGEKMEDYRRLDDDVVWGAIERVSRSKDERAKGLANRLRNREALRVLDLTQLFGHDPEQLLNAERCVDQHIGDRIGVDVFKDSAPFTLYSRIGGETAKAHKMVRVRTGNGGVQEITKFPDTIISSQHQSARKLIRYYFLVDEDKASAEKAMKGR